MEIRSIDTAKDASLDLMTLNKKVVNMRATVKRSKVHVITKLTRSIADLKKKRGSDEEKEKNLKKAQRYFDEIQSIRSLKEDKITKYSLANVSTFEQISKATISPGARALARLADHRLMKDAVNKFREEHSDWRDLAAFMLMQQTGRKFKSQKQKDKKSISRAENINASKLMTQAYTQGLFREDGFQKAAEIFEKKRRKKKDKTTDSNENAEEGHNVDNEKEPSENGGFDDDDDDDDEIVFKNVGKQGIKNTNEEPDADGEEDEKIANKGDLDRDSTGDKLEKIHGNILRKTEKPGETLQQKSQTKGGTPSHKILGKQGSDNELSKEDDREEEEEMEEQDDASSTNENDESIGEEDSEEEEEEEEEMEEQADASSTNENDEDGDSEDIESEEEQVSHQHAEKSESEEDSKSKSKVEEPPVKIRKRYKECVIQEFDIGNEDSGSESEDEIGSSSDDSEEDEDAGSDQEENETKELEIRKKLEKILAKKGKAMPDFLTKGDSTSRKLPHDPFFEGNDNMEEYSYQEEENVNDEGVDEVDDSDIQERFKGNKQTTKSLFYRPGEKKKVVYEKRDYGADRGSYSDKGRGRGRGRDGFSNIRGRGRGGFDSRSRGGFDSRSRGGFDSRSRGGFDSRSRGGFGDKTRGGFDDRRGKRGFSGSRGRGSHDFNSSSGSSGLPARKQADSSVASKPAGKLHPSWEASKKRKSEQSGIKAFAGTKITFGDD